MLKLQEKKVSPPTIGEAKIETDGETNVSESTACEQIMQAQGCLRIPLECIRDVCCVDDLKGAFIDTNGVAEELRGYKRELIGKSFLDLNLLLPE